MLEGDGAGLVWQQQRKDDDNNDVDANSTNSTTAVNPLREKYRGNHFRFLQTYGIWA